MLSDLLSAVANLAVPFFAVTSMLSVGFAYSARQILAPLRDVRALLRALLANFVLVPLFTVGILRLWPIDRPLEAGLLLVALSAGAPFLIKLTAAARAEVALSATLLVLLLPVTVLYAPIVVPRVLPEAEVSVVALATPLVLAMLLPLAIALLINSRWPERARRWAALTRRLSTAALVVLVVATTLANIPTIIELFVEGAIGPPLLMIAGAFVIGYLLGGKDRDVREVLGLGTAQRNISAATVMATQGFGNSALVMVIVTSLAGFALLFPVAAVLRRRPTNASKRRAADAGTTRNARGAG
ncbi:bile acid:sodium symporter family protein [Micromonospora sp. DT48]|uniref:bile acid:sodium symporter family protein n=1 Tax=unclassified Micromonospora TaxID=2617518 RepID=UPI0012BBBF6F|nr:bile acid:sodium symporter [Micromonospora sp. CP22]MTK05243.1 transporter [Micromonospora sp. CP22]